MEPGKQKIELCLVNSRPKINVVKYRREDVVVQPRNPLLLNRRRLIIPRYVPVYSKPARDVERPRVNVVAQW